MTDTPTLVKRLRTAAPNYDPIAKKHMLEAADALEAAREVIAQGRVLLGMHASEGTPEVVQWLDRSADWLARHARRGR